MNIQEFEWSGFVLVLIGPLLGIAGANYGGIKNSNGPKERAFAVKGLVCGMCFWTVLYGLIVGLRYVLPQPYNSWTLLLALLFVPYVLISSAIADRRLAKIRAEESQEKSP